MTLMNDILYQAISQILGLGRGSVQNSWSFRLNSGVKMSFLMRLLLRD